MPGHLALVGSSALPAAADATGWASHSSLHRVGVVVSAMPSAGSTPADLDDVITINSRAAADDPAIANRIHGAAVIGLYGSDATFISRALRGSEVWSSIETAWRGGASLIGFGEGATALCGYIPDVRNPVGGGAAGLGVIPGLRALTHFDSRTRLLPDSALRPLVTDGATVVGIDASAALVAEPPDEGDEWQFRPRGDSSTWRIELDRRHRVISGLRLRVSA